MRNTIKITDDNNDNGDDDNNNNNYKYFQSCDDLTELTFVFFFLIYLQSFYRRD